jgi:DNA-binding response OmpR family regulator
MLENIKVLVVDDDRRMVKTICDILNVKGHEAIEAYTGIEAVEKVKSDNPDCVLMDIKMPGVNGVDALGMIRDISPFLPVILVSAYAEDEVWAIAREKGAYACLTKPVDIQTLLSFLSLLRKEESILVVDDDPDFCKTLKAIFQSRGFRVETEFDPAKVLSRMEKGYTVAVVLDLDLGSANGLDLLKDIRAKYPSKPVVLVTGNAGETADKLKEGYKLGAHACFHKSLEIDSLIKTIEEIGHNKLRAVLG